MMRWRQCWYRTSWDPYTLDTDFLKRLAKFDDGRIRLRWSPDREQWIVERKLAHSVEYVHHIPEFKKRVDWNTGRTWEIPNDFYICARDGYIIIDYVNPYPAPRDWLIGNLQFNDIRRWGGHKEFARKLEAFEEAREDKKKKSQRDRWRHLASDAYDHLKRRYGEQVFVPREASGVTR